ncbi:MAG: hypothetical protein AVDCRST_MAG28-2083 [uncultured Rubrobacteraceae bacterium]|uniref:Uncharacterized protein n=1 Tax=uncultured Rubrobacteraceae bacterium TaxID=349277 RepID=A0A6J4QSJ4_9ACTN|nr:MAG: hypothetical protein AVDCRST_MAG28-2083 [uncultured Rubrobacteraceae bacterium]
MRCILGAHPIRMRNQASEYQENATDKTMQTCEFQCRPTV